MMENNFKETGEYGLMNYELIIPNGDKFIVSEFGCDDNEIKIGNWNNSCRVPKKDIPKLIEILKELTK